MTLTRLPILVYHYFGPDRAIQPGIKPEDTAYITPVDLFRSHLQFLKSDGYQPVSFASVLAAVQSVTPLPPKPIVITIDDGHASAALHAAPILAEFGYSAELFVIPSKVGTTGFADWETLKSLTASKIVVQSHGLTHRRLTSLQDDDITHELTASKQLIETHLHQPVTALAVPMGRYPHGLDRKLPACGYQIGCTSVYGCNTPVRSLLALERIMIKAPHDTPAALAQLLDPSSSLAWRMRVRSFAKRLRTAVIG